MSTDKDLDKAKASAMDDVKIKESRIPNFTVEKKAGVSKTAKAEAQPTGQKANDIDNIVSMPKLRVLRGAARKFQSSASRKALFNRSWMFLLPKRWIRSLMPMWVSIKMG